MFNKNKVKTALKKTCHIQTIISIFLVSISLFYYGKSFYQNKQLIFGMDDTKIVLGLTIMLVWIMVFTVYLMLELNKKDKIIIKQNEYTQGQNKKIQEQNIIIQTLLNKVIIQADENTETIIEQNDDNFDQLMKSSKNTKELVIDIHNMDNNDNRGDNIA